LVAAAALQTHFAQTKRELPAGTPHKELMSRLAADYKLHKASAQQQQQQPSQQASADLHLQPSTQQQLDDELQQESQVEVVELSESEDEACSGSKQQQQQAGSWDVPGNQDDVGGLLSFLERLDLAGTE
jgi:hypothetical protein